MTPAPLPYARRTRLLVSVLSRARRWTGRVTRRTPDGTPVVVAPGVHDPAPFGLGLTGLMVAAPIREGERVLDVGTGSGFWAVLAARAGGRVLATDLGAVPFESLRALAEAERLDLDARHGDLFAPVAGERFDVVLFNPPFHDGAPASEAERAWVGGDVLRRFLAGLPEVLAPGGRAYLLLPGREHRRYAAELAALRQVRLAGTRLPLLGRVGLYELRPGGTGLRPASPSARTWRRLAELGETRSCELLALDGHLDPDRLEAALEVVAGLHPLLQARPEGGGWRLGVAPLRLGRESSRVPLTRADLLARTWSDGDPGAVDATLLTDPDRHWIRLRVPHDRTDARSGAQVMQDLASAYTALAEGGRLPARLDAAPWDPARLVELGPADLFRAARRILADLLARPAWLVPPGRPRGPPRVAVVDTAPDGLPRLKALAKANGTTAHAWLTLHAARAFGVSRLVDLVTLRPLATVPVDARSDVLVAPWVQRWPAGASTPDALAAIAARVHDIKHGGARAECARLALYTSVAGLLPTALAAEGVFRFVVKTDLFVTNPGPVHVPLERFGPVRVADFVNYPVLVPPARAGLVFTTFRERLRVVALWDGEAFPEGIAGRVDTMLRGAGIG